LAENLQSKIDYLCRSNGIYYISANSNGLLGRIFCDFGPTFEIADTTGEQEIDLIIKEVNNSSEIILLDGTKHTLQTNDEIVFVKADEEGQGLTYLGKKHKIKLLKHDII
jgi:ubiquitin-activating enzyme E1